MMNKNLNFLYFGSLPIIKYNDVYKSNEDEIEYIKSLKYLNKNGFFLSDSYEILKDVKLKKIKNCINNTFEDYKTNILEIENNFYISQSWTTINKNQGFHGAHTHKNTLFSCVLYLQANDSAINFYLNNSAIQNHFNFSYKVKNYNECNSTSWRLPVKTGDLVIFPGHLKHSSEENKNNEDRIIVGANYFIKDEIGNKADWDFINIKTV